MYTLGIKEERVILLGLSNILKRQKNLLKNQIRTNYAVPKLKGILMMTKGFYKVSNIIYDLSNGNHENYLSDYDRHKTKNINGDGVILLKDKILFEETFRDLLPVSRNISAIHNGKINSIGNYNVDDFNSLLNYIKENRAVVLKPIRGTGGAGIMVIKWYDGLVLNNKKITQDDLENKVKQLKDYFANEYIEQGNFENKLNDKSLNTVRIVTMKDVETGKAFIPAVVQRIGNKTSSPTDNWTQGGLSCWVDVETGVLGKGARHPKVSGKLEWFEKHPDTGAQIEGSVIPNWDTIKNDLLSAVNKSEHLTYVGWDVVITDDGFRIIEGNSMPDVNLLQVHRPLLKDERVRKFYKHYKVIK